MLNARKTCTGLIAAGAAAAAIGLATPALADDGSGASPGVQCTGTTAPATDCTGNGGNVDEGPGPGGPGYNGEDPRGD